MWQMAIGVLEENKAANRSKECWSDCDLTCGGQGCLTEMITVRNWGEASEKDLTLTGGHSKCKSPNCRPCCCHYCWCVPLGRILYVCGDVSLLVHVLNKCTQMPSLKSIPSASFLYQHVSEAFPQQTNRSTSFFGGCIVFHVVYVLCVVN